MRNTPELTGLEDTEARTQSSQLEDSLPGGLEERERELGLLLLSHLKP